MTNRQISAFLRNFPASNLDRYIEECRVPFESMLETLVGFPTVSPRGMNNPSIDKCIRKAASLVRCLGGSPTLITPEGGTPALFWTHISNPDWPTMILYNHLDVMPVNQESDFHLRKEERDGNTYYYGRGAADNKGPALVGLLAVKWAIQKECPMNFVIIWETEEEIGSYHFASFLETVKRRLTRIRRPFLLVSDTNWVDSKFPTITTALRGLVKFIFELTCAVERDPTSGNLKPKENHSGSVGGAAPNPITRLNYALSQCVGPDGTILIPGFYDGVEGAQKEDLDFLVSHEIFTIDAFRRTHGFLGPLPTEDPKEALRRIWDRPTLELTGFHGGTTVMGSVASSIPGSAASWVSMRVGIGQNPERLEAILRSFVTSIDPHITITRIGGVTPPIHFNTRERHIATGARALKNGYGHELTIFDRSGGSINAVVLLSGLMPNLKVLLMGTSRPDDNAHADNENYDWTQAAGGIHSFVNYFYELSLNRPLLY